MALARTREEILLAAARVLARSGHRAVSMTDIAAEVGFTAPALYVYFDSKERIFQALVAMLGREIGETFVSPPRGMPFAEKIRLLVRETLTWADRRREFLLALVALKMRGFRFVPGPVKGLRAAPDDGNDPVVWDVYSPRVADWLRQAGRRAPELVGRDHQEAACVLVGIMHGFVLRWLMGRSPQHLAGQTDRIVDYFLYGLQGGAAHA